MSKITDFIGQSIYRKILAGFGAVILLIVGISTYFHLGVSRVQRISRQTVPTSEVLIYIQDYALALSSLDANIDRLFVIGGAEIEDNIAQDLLTLENAVKDIETGAPEDIAPAVESLQEASDVLATQTNALIALRAEDASPRAVNEQTLAVFGALDTASQYQKDLTAETLDSLETTIETQQGIISRTLTWALIVALLAVAIAGAASYFISNSIVDPISELAAVASRIAEGDLGARVSIRAKDETGLLANTFNHMTQQLSMTLESERRIREEVQEANLKLQESEAMLERRVEERTHELELVNADLEVALQQAKEADKIKSQFLASMSHELRTPLNAILSFSKYMRQGIFGPVTDEQVDYLSKTVDSGEHLLSLINDVLDVTKIQSGMLKLYVEEGFDVEQELENIIASAEKMLAGKPVKLMKEIDDDLPPLTCDKRRIRQIFYNLVSNALKFTDEGAITISAHRVNGELMVSVADTGPGIAPEDQKLIFEPFIQTETGIKHAGGTGLGLPISKQLAQSHGGRLWVESETGEGASFYLALPVNSHAAVKEDKLEVRYQ